MYFPLFFGMLVCDNLKVLTKKFPCTVTHLILLLVNSLNKVRKVLELHLVNCNNLYYWFVCFLFVEISLLCT